MSRIHFRIVIISFVFALLQGSGFYGFGIDFYAAYHKSNIVWGSLLDSLGWMVSTLTVYKTHIGVYVVSFVISMSVGLLLFKTTYWYFDRRYYWFYLLHLMTLHTWPIIMSTSNAMRQGLAMGFLFLALHSLLSKKYIFCFVWIGFLILTHKSGILFALLLIGFNILNIKIQNWFKSPRMQRNLLIISSFLSAIFVFTLIPVIFNNHEPSRIISGDYRIPFLVINTAYIVIFFKYLFNKRDQIDVFLLICSSILPIFLFHGFNWEYERLNMMILILYIIAFSRIFYDRDKKLVLFSSTVLLLFMTFFTGMYASLK